MFDFDIELTTKLDFSKGDTNKKMKEIYQAMAASLPLDDTVPECDESAVARPGGA